MERTWKRNPFWLFGLGAAMLLGLPPVGLMLAGRALGPYLEFPPRAPFIAHAPFSWAVFSGYAFIGAAMAGLIILLGVRSRHRGGEAGTCPRRLLPWWGFFGVGGGLCAWFFAWTRFTWFAPFQAHTFTALWVAYIVTVNALIFRCEGGCPLTERPLAFLLLFPVSAFFWWFFEYLNRFIQNWHYVNVTFDAWSYFTYATLSFATVLPAVYSTQRLLLTHPWLGLAFQGVWPVRFLRPRAVAWGTLVMSGLILIGIGIWPDYLFAGLWCAPLLMISSLQALRGGEHPFREVASGNWQGVVTWALGALVCGFFWEMWNAWSLAKWEYSVPFVQRFHVFEMPLLGYAGYLPFGLECAAMTDLILPPSSRR